MYDILDVVGIDVLCVGGGLCGLDCGYELYSSCVDCELFCFVDVPA